MKTRLIGPLALVAALSFEAGDRHPVVSTIADQVAGIPQIHPSAETVLNYRPDLVVMFAGTMPKLHAHLAALGVAVVDVPDDPSVDAIRKTTRLLAAQFGVREKGERMLAAMDVKLAAARRLAANPPVRTLIYEPNGYATSGPVTEELMGVAGLVDAAPAYARTRSGRIPIEAVVSAAPELLIFSGDPAARQTRADLVLHHPALAALAGRTATAWDRLTPLLCAGPWSAEAALTLARIGRQTRAPTTR